MIDSRPRSEGPSSQRVLLSTSLRSGRRAGAQGEEVSGSLLVGELDTGAQSFALLGEVDVPPSPHRPGRRSVRGIAPFAGGVAVCNSTQLFLFDRDLARIQTVYSAPLFGDIHTLTEHAGVLYVTATASDSVVGLDRNLEQVFEWWAGAEPELDPFLADHHRQRRRQGDDFRLPSRYRDRFHVNQVAFTAGGDMIVSLPDLEFGDGVSKFWNVTRREFHLAGRPELRPIVGRIHDGLFLGDCHYLGWTERGRFLKLCARSGRTLCSVDCSVPLGTTTGNPVASRHGWLRGAAHLGGELFLVGQSMLTLFLVDMRQGVRTPPLRWESAAAPPDDPGLAIYCIARAPEQVAPTGSSQV
ncbi:MAG TPA: hypothetical protein VHR45_15780 [Thermoanaerobaculia bacterium]|nr:hypothetical protein [Thermoanaerobaculia bacterium]